MTALTVSKHIHPTSMVDEQPNDSAAGPGPSKPETGGGAAQVAPPPKPAFSKSDARPPLFVSFHFVSSLGLEILWSTILLLAGAGPGVLVLPDFRLLDP